MDLPGADSVTPTPPDPDAPDDLHCPMFQFIVDSVITGMICLFGFAGNTASFMTLWHEKVCVSTFLLQAVIIADFTVLWMLFIGDSVPGLGLVIRMLQDCETTCKYVTMVTGPLLFLAQICGIWLTLLAMSNRYILMCKPSQAPVYCTLDTAKKHVIVIILIAVVLTLPLTFDYGVFVSSTLGNRIVRQRLSENFWYQLMYQNCLLMFAVYVVPILGLVYLLVRLARVVQSVHRLRRSLAASYRIQHMDLTQLLLTVTITMVICYLPTVITRGFKWAEGHPPERCATLLYYLDSFSKVFLALNSSIKIILLCLFVKDFKDKVRQSLSCVSCVRSKDLPTSDSSYSMYKCADMSEMTLISNADSRL